MGQPNEPGGRQPPEGHDDPLPGSASVRKAEREGTAPKPSDDLPPAGQHARPDLINEDATPGAGTLPPAGGHDDVDSTSG